MGGSSTRVEGAAECSLEHPAGQIAYRLHRRKRRGLRISITPELTVNVFAPRRASMAWIEAAVNERRDWIAGTLQKVAACTVLRLPRLPEVGSDLLYMGRPYRLVVYSGSPRRVDLLLDSLLVTIPNPDNGMAVGRQLKAWYRAQANALFTESVRRCIPHVRDLRVDTPIPRIRDMRSRWGSCTSDGRITLNLKLAMLPERLIDYVVMHELCHLVHHDHSKRYYRVLTEAMPDWRERRKDLNRYRMS